MADEERDSPLPKLADLETQIDLPVFEVKGNIPPLEGPVVVGGNDMDSLQSFADAVDAKAVMVQYDFFDPDDYLVAPEKYAFEQILDEDELDELLDLIDEHNENVYALLDEDDAYEPIACSVFVMYEGMPYGVYDEDVELIESFGENAEEFLSRALYNIYFDVSDEEDVPEKGQRDRIQTT